ncbi:uracil-DNA glycosylase [Geomonas sp. Red69]|uniref:Uracil-DNA glycosylase n=1 Tax=Geomonas diazotrophica TaxID=2843197 RepID=A0ABX8JFI5_9BACT|nr:MULTISPECIES: uracil-DNA glycosylase family protein [Geomonas]MBU5638187.1 uracil-DNA glycosylase [Geomonas diazotrophica]QWV95906.1 uracil-DNA glycosylase [Geomonas nitrogeniifigens]QXE84992.1 uracil-DNA glycosylase [Geomonas nitrogeniifigens]
MAEMEERELLLRSLKGYLTDLADSGLDELAFGALTPTVAPPASATAATAVALAAAPSAPVAPSPAAVSAPPAGTDETAAPFCRQEGDPHARLLFLMSGGGFAGAAGELLAKIVVAMKFRTDQVCLVSFDSAGDSAAVAREVAQRIAAVEPEVVVALGEEATRLLLGGEATLEQVRGSLQDVRGRAVMPTLHPESLLADEALKRHVWEDMKLVMRRLAGAA